MVHPLFITATLLCFAVLGLLIWGLGCEWRANRREYRRLRGMR